MLSLRDSPHHSTLREIGDIVAHILLYAQIPMDAFTRNKFEQFKSNPPLSSFKKLIVLTPRLLHGLHTMSLAKAVPDGLKDCECERTTLHKWPLVPYVPKKDVVQEMVSAMNNDRSLKTTIGEGTGLCLSTWNTGDAQSPSHARGINFGHDQETRPFQGLQRIPRALYGATRSSKAGKGCSG